MRDKINQINQPHKRDGRRPRLLYERPVRNRIIECCLVENRRPTSLEVSEISLETGRLAKAGYYLLSMMDEDHTVIDQLPFNDIDGGDDDNSASGHNLSL